MRRVFGLWLVMMLIMISFSSLVSAGTCWIWDGSAWQEDNRAVSSGQCDVRANVYHPTWSSEAPSAPPPGTSPPEPEEASTPTTPSAPAPSGSTPPEGTTLDDGSGGRFRYIGGRWTHIDEEDNDEDLSDAQQQRLRDAYADPQSRGRFTVPPTDMIITAEQAEIDSSGYTGPAAMRGNTFSSYPDETQRRAGLGRCQQGYGACHVRGDDIVIGPAEERRSGRTGGSSDSGSGGGGDEPRVRFYTAPDRDTRDDGTLQTDGGHEYIRREDGTWVRREEGEAGPTTVGDDALRARLERGYDQTREQNFQRDREQCQLSRGVACRIESGRIVYNEEGHERDAYFGSYAPGSDALRAGIERCSGNHAGGGCRADDSGNIYYTRSENEQPREYWSYNTQTGEIKRTTEAACSTGNPQLLCHTSEEALRDDQVRDYLARVERQRMQNIWEGKTVVRSYITILNAFGVDDDWDTEAFEGLTDWAQTTEGLAVSGHWAESICRYTPDLDSTTGMVKYPGSGQFGMWIEGAKTVSIQRNQSDPERAERVKKIYKITGSVMPAGMTFNSGSEGCADKVRFNIMLDDTVVDLGEEGTADDMVVLNCDTAPYALLGQNAMYIIDSKNYERICFRFDPRNLKAAISQQLHGGLICARIVESGSPADMGCEYNTEFMGSPIDCSNLPDANPEETGSSPDEPGENRPTPRPPMDEI